MYLFTYRNNGEVFWTNVNQFDVFLHVYAQIGWVKHADQSVLFTSRVDLHFRNAYP